MGPVLSQGQHIINIYNQGTNDYSTFDIGHSKTAQDCCIECHMDEQSCTGSVFNENGNKCLLLRKDESTCYNGTSSASTMISRPAGEREKHKGAWPSFVVSNGPCGYLYDGGLGS